jgi:hypothetical protein
MRTRVQTRALTALLACLLLAPLHAPSAAEAKGRGSGGQSAPGPGSAPRSPKDPKPISPEAPLPPQTPAGDSTLARELGSSGQVDPVAGLGIRNPVCDRLTEIRDRQTRLACEAHGAPESTYPTSNYGLDVFIATGVTHPVGTFTAGFVTILNGIWLGLIFVLKLTLELLGLAFGLNPFAEGPTMQRISASVARIYQRLSEPWLTALIICAGIWFAHRGLLRRDLGGAVGGTLAALAMLVLGLWVVHQPGDSVGRLAGISNQVALTTVSAPPSGSLHRPVGTYAESMSRTWADLVEVPFAGLNFSDVSWALSRPPPEAVERADRWFCDDVGALSLIAAYAHLGSESAGRRCAAFARRRYGRPRRVIDLYLRSSPGSPARQALWNYFDKDEDERYKAKVAAQGGDGALTRLSMLALFALGLLGAILLLAWLAIRLFTQAAIAFVLLLAAPLALLLPLLGDAGRRAFKTWGLTLLGSLVGKVIYAALLSIVLLGISILGRVEGAGGSATGFLLSSAFTWAVFLKRADLIGRLSIGDSGQQGPLRLGLAGTAAIGLTRRGVHGAGDLVRGTTRRGLAWQREHRLVSGEATRRTAQASLSSSARALADSRHAGARQASGGDGSAAEASTPGLAPAAPGSEPRRTEAPDGAAAHESEIRRGGNPRRHEAAERLVQPSKRDESPAGGRPSQPDLRRLLREDRELLERSRDPADHAHRAGIDRARFESLRGPDRERAVEQIEKARRRDLQRLAVVDSSPGKVTGRGRTAAEGVRQRLEGSAEERRRHLRDLRRDPGLIERLQPRRNLSRGA